MIKCQQSQALASHFESFLSIVNIYLDLAHRTAFTAQTGSLVSPTKNVTSHNSGMEARNLMSSANPDLFSKMLESSNVSVGKTTSGAAIFGYKVSSIWFEGCFFAEVGNFLKWMRKSLSSLYWKRNQSTVGFRSVTRWFGEKLVIFLGSKSTDQIRIFVF